MKQLAVARQRGSLTPGFLKMGGRKRAWTGWGCSLLARCLVIAYRKVSMEENRR